MLFERDRPQLQRPGNWRPAFDRGQQIIAEADMAQPPGQDRGCSNLAPKEYPEADCSRIAEIERPDSKCPPNVEGPDRDAARALMLEQQEPRDQEGAEAEE